VFKYLVGFCLGFFVCFILIVQTILNDIEIDVMATTSAFIAIATIVAVFIQVSSIKQQRKDRLWDLNKGILLDLSHTLSLSIKATEYYRRRRITEEHGLDQNHFPNTKPEDGVFDDFKDKQELAINVYKMLMSSELIDALLQAKLTDDEISLSVEYDDIDHMDAYDASLASKDQLKKKLDLFIAEMAGVKDM